MAIAIEAFEERLAADATDVRAGLLAGRSYVKLAMGGGEEPGGLSREVALARGEAHLKSILKTSPTHPDANYWLGGAYLMSGRDTEANQIIELLRSIDPEKSAELADLRD